MKRTACVVAAAFTAGRLGPAWAQDRPWEWGWHPMWGMWSAWGIGMLLVMLTFWVLVIVALIAGVRWLIHQGREPGREPRRDSALEILRERYARGEINKEEFDAKKRDLS
ncbi:MAG TPA: SHOCT domain-containing protein [Methylomirabilota bacterium]|jgi:putative membrane protein|nr:SHOCT domain-containing protein [Methylomirabilota bacterium]